MRQHPWYGWFTGGLTESSGLMYIIGVSNCKFQAPNYKYISNSNFQWLDFETLDK